MSWLSNSFQEHTISWLLISTISGSILGSAITLLFEDIIRPKIALSRETKRLFKKYRNPLLNSAASLERQINTIVRTPNKGSLLEEYYLLSTFYKFGSFLYWVRCIEVDFGYMDLSNSKRSKMFTEVLYGPFSGLSSIRKYFNDVPFVQAQESTIPRDIARAIGEEMFDETNKQNPGPIGFSKFVKKFRQDVEFKLWFDKLENMLKKVASSNDQIYLERLIVTGAHLVLLLRFLDPERLFSKHKFVNLELIERKELIEDLKNSGISANEAE